jgi:hypothetical protein
VNAIHTEEVNGYTIKIFTDNDPTSPEDHADSSAFLVYGHRSFQVHGPNKEKAFDVHKNKTTWGFYGFDCCKGEARNAVPVVPAKVSVGV